MKKKLSKGTQTRGNSADSHAGSPVAIFEGVCWGSFSKILNPEAAGSNPARCFVAILLAVAIAGCGHSKPKPTDTPMPDRHAMTMEPVEVAKPDPAPVAQDVSSAKVETQAAQSGLIELAKAAAGAGPAALSAIQSIQNHLTEAVKALDAANAHIQDLETQIAAKEKFIAAEKAAYATNAANYEREQADYVAKSGSTITALQAENADLKNAALNSIRKWMYVIGSLLCVAGVGSIFLRFYIGFAVGGTLGAFMIPAGMAIIGFAGLLPKIQEWAEWGLIGAGIIGAIALVWGLVHAFLHPPVPAKAVAP